MSGFHHLGLATNNMEATIEFYESVLGFETKVTDLMSNSDFTGEGAIRHAFIDVGDGSFVAFMEPNRVPTWNDAFDASINEGLGLPRGVYHFSFRSEDEAALEARQADLRAKGVKVTDVVDHDWCKSIYFTDPNGLLLEFCTTTEALEPRHLADSQSAGWAALARTE